MTLWTRFQYWRFRRKNGYPSANEMRDLLSEGKAVLSKTVYRTCDRYSLWGNLAHVAQQQGMTRERVRQIVLKGYRQLKSS